MRLAISTETADWRYFRMLVTDWAILSDFRMAKKSTVHVKPVTRKKIFKDSRKE